MNKIEKLRYIKNCDSRYKVLFKLYDWIMFMLEFEKSQDTYAEYWGFVLFCNQAKFKLNIPEVRKFTNKDNYLQVFEDLKLQFENIEKTKNLVWSEKYKIIFDDEGRLNICIFDNYYAPDYPEDCC